MSYVTLPQAKAHANVAGDVSDAMLQLYIDSAEAAVSNYLNRGLDSLLLEEDPASFPLPVLHAILMHVADSIENRGTVIVGTSFQILPSAERLLFPYRLELGA